MNETIRQTARNLRKNQTSSERYFWNLIRNRKFNNIKFYRQYSIRFLYNNKYRFYVADFYCSRNKTIIELDGKIHENQKERDKFRDYICKSLGYRVIRIKSFDVMNNISKILLNLKKETS